jgi:hypothetical protein
MSCTNLVGENLRESGTQENRPHSGIGYHTPADVHYGHAHAVRAARADTLTAAYTRTPERFVRKHPEPPALPTTARINQPSPDPTTDDTKKP